MAEFASSIIKSLGSAALREYGRINGVMDKLEELRRNVETSRAVLLDLDEKQEKSNAEQNLVKILKDVLIPADDLLDEFLIQDMIHKRDEPHQNKFKKVLNPIPLIKKIVFLHDKAPEIDKRQKVFDDVLKVTSGLINPSENAGVVQKTNDKWRETCSYVIESNIIGRDVDKEKIVNLLRQPHGDQDVSFVAIVGVGGLGKTTLAQLVYKYLKVQNLFEKSMWVCVSDNFDVKTILNKMLESLTGNKIADELSLDSLQEKLCDNLTGKRYFLVLDDIWNKSHEKWDKLRSYLMCGAQGSKVLVTTRDKTVALTMGVSDPYVLNGLTPEESWGLLKKIAFMDDTIGVDQTFESIGKEIAKKCKGVPLAIRSLGNILKNKREEEQWYHILKGDFWKLCEEKESILPILKLSYNDLLSQERQCFAYCSLFPKDWEFEKDELIQMWMAHGYLDCSVGGKCMEDLGNQFVNIFMMKSFFQEAKLNVDGDTSFKMHDLMHDLAIQVAGDDFCYLISKTDTCPGKPVHVSVELGAFCLLESLDASRLRTLIVFSSFDNCSMDKKKLSIISTFKYLRVLKLFDLGVGNLCVSIEKWKHLRFLNLISNLESVDKSIGNLVCLQTLNMAWHTTKISRKGVSKLINLRHLNIRGWDFKDKTPVGFEKLSIQQQEGGVIFSKWLSPLTNIIKIQLHCCNDMQYLPPLERLPFLKSLKLDKIKYLEYIYYEEPILHESFFPSLETLVFNHCYSLKGWRRMGDDLNDIKSSHDVLLLQFPCLSNLTIEVCWKLTHMPTFPSIKRFAVDACCTMKILEATLNITRSQYLIGFPPLSMLKSLQINETILDMKHVPQDWLQNLTSLENLEFYVLSSEEFEPIEKWFKDDINYLPSLQKITFVYCKDLKALPDWICKISSLQHIKIEICFKLTLLPEGMTRLTNLHTLEIIKCPLLAEECEKETSATRPTIAHIPNIIIKNDWF